MVGQVEGMILSKMKGAVKDMAAKKRTVENCIHELMKLPCNDEKGLLDALGYKGKRDNTALIAAVIFSKAQSGDMNCLKEVLRMCMDTAEGATELIKIIDDVK